MEKSFLHFSTIYKVRWTLRKRTPTKLYSLHVKKPWIMFLITPRLHDPWKWSHSLPSKRQLPLTHQLTITSQWTWILIHTSVTTINTKTFTITLFYCCLSKTLKVSPRLREESKEKVISVYFKRALAALSSTAVITWKSFTRLNYAFLCGGKTFTFNRTVLLKE